MAAHPMRGWSRRDRTARLPRTMLPIAPHIVGRDHLQQRKVDRSGNRGSKSTHDHRHAHSRARKGLLWNQQGERAPDALAVRYAIKHLTRPEGNGARVGGAPLSIWRKTRDDGPRVLQLPRPRNPERYLDDHLNRTNINRTKKGAMVIDFLPRGIVSVGRDYRALHALSICINRSMEGYNYTRLQL